MQNADDLGFEVGDTVERIQQKSAGSFIERKRHGVDGEVAAAQILVNGGRHHDGGLAGFLEALGAGHADFGAGIAGQREEDGADIFFDGGDFGAGFFELFLQLERIALDSEIEIADGEAADDVANGATGEVKIHAGGTGYVLHEADAFELVRRQPDFHRVNVISHSLSIGGRTRDSGPDQPGFPQDFHRPKPSYYRDLSHRNASGERQSTYTKWKLCGKLKKITQRLRFGYCQGGFRQNVAKKCENLKTSDQ